jgi:hypothetical protein
MIYELRTYRCSPGRLQDMLDTFGRHVVPLWERHGVHSVGFWTVVIGDSNHDFIYMLRWDSAAERESKWEAINSDPIWMEARAKSEENGPLVMSIKNQLLEPTTFSGLP